MLPQYALICFAFDRRTQTRQYDVPGRRRVAHRVGYHGIFGASVLNQKGKLIVDYVLPNLIIFALISIHCFTTSSRYP